MNGLTSESRAERQQRAERESSAAFSKWLAKPESKLALSLIPAGDASPEALQVLLRGAFDAGYAHGIGEVTGMILDGMLRSERNRGL
jgi:hypothetical protein